MTWLLETSSRERVLLFRLSETRRRHCRYKSMSSAAMSSILQHLIRWNGDSNGKTVATTIQNTLLKKFLHTSKWSKSCIWRQRCIPENEEQRCADNCRINQDTFLIDLLIYWLWLVNDYALLVIIGWLICSLQWIHIMIYFCIPLEYAKSGGCVLNW